jgi:hypothetical protein
MAKDASGLGPPGQSSRILRHPLRQTQLTAAGRLLAYKRSHPATGNVMTIRAVLSAGCVLACTTMATKGHPIGWMSPEVMARAQDILAQYGQIKAKQPIETYFTNAFVPGT